MKVDEAVRTVVRAHPALRTLVLDYDSARRAFHSYEATLIWLAGRGCIPNDLSDAAPSKNATRYAEPDSAWLEAIEALKRDADAPLPS